VRHSAFPHEVTREEILAWYRQTRTRTRELFDLVAPEAYYERPIALRNPIVFYEGHLPGFSVNTLVKLAHRRAGIDEKLETLFARGIDPEDEAAVRSPTDVWPSRDTVHAFAAECDALVESVLANAVLEDDAVPHLRGGEAIFTILEHELMHQETLLYMLHNLPYDRKRPRESREVHRSDGRPQASLSPEKGQRVIPAGSVTLGQTAGTFGWDNEFPAHPVSVDAFSIDAHPVSNGDYLEYIHETGAQPPHFWERNVDDWSLRGMFALQSLPLESPVYVTHAEAAAYARWRGMRLPTEAEFHRAAYGTPEGGERLHPWGDEQPDETRGNFDFVSFDPVENGSYPAGASAWGVHDLTGNGWEWTSSVFEGFDGFAPMPSYLQYSADFFDDAHYVLKGASPVTASALIRRSFRNWFRPNYPYVFAKFRCASCT
jgi:formylglycine-generating enzyme required for sulfatase activity